MKDTIKQFWYNLLEKLDGKINQWLNRGKTGSGETRIDDDSVVNFFAMVLKKVLNHVFMSCTFQLVTDSAQAEPLGALCEDLQKNCYKIGTYMLGGSDTPQNISECWVVPSMETVGGRQTLFHTYLRGDRVRITGMAAGNITDCYMILDMVKRNDKPYLLCRRHTLDGNGNLTISYFIADAQAQEVRADIPEWQGIVQQEITYPGAHHIGFGRYKSPVVAPDANDTYGKPLNYGCGVIEKELQICLQQIQREFKSKRTLLFAHPGITRVREEQDEHGNIVRRNSIDEYIFTAKPSSGESVSGMIAEFSPEIRESSYYAHLKELIKQYEALCGLNNLIQKDQTGQNATATEIRMLNIDNISLEENIRSAVRAGNIMTLEADSLYLGIRTDLWTYDETWTDIYEDEQQRLLNMLTLYENGAVEQIDLIKYWYPTLTEEEAQEKLLRINESRQGGTQDSLERLLNM